MIEKIKCQNNHKMIIDWDNGTIYNQPCINLAKIYRIILVCSICAMNVIRMIAKENGPRLENYK